MIEQFRVAAVRSIKQLAEVLKPVERFYPLIGAIGTEPIYDLDETFFEGMACQIQVAVLDFVEIPIDHDSDGLDIYGYTQIGRPTVVFGEGGSGNSYWALHLACTVAASGKRVGVAGLRGRPQRLAKTSARDTQSEAGHIICCTAFQDAGKAVHPSYVEGQMQGGAVQGLGWAINEEYVISDEGQLLNSSLLDYRMMTTLDVPMIDTVIVEVANPGHPFGVRGVGEGSIVPPMAAVANAIYRAVGVRMNQLPMSPAAMLDTIHNKTD